MRRWMEPASRDIATQVQVVRSFLQAHGQSAEQAAAADAQGAEVGWRTLQDVESTALSRQAEATSGASSQSEECLLRLYDPEEHAQLVAWAKSLPSDSSSVVLGHLRRAKQLGPFRHAATQVDEAALLQLEQDFPHFAEVSGIVRKRLALSRLTADAPLKLPCLLLAGPPGTGKTAYAQRLAQALAVPVTVVDMSTVDTGFKLTGLDMGYSTGKPGLIWDALQGECMSPVVVLDEIDKPSTGAQASGLDYLLGLFEPVSARAYRDAAIRLALDASFIHWLATCNDVTAIDAPLLSRLRVVHILPPNPAQMGAVVRSVYADLRRSEAWGQVFPAALPDAVMAALSTLTPREVRQSIEEGCASAAVEGRRQIEVRDLPVGPRLPERRPMGFGLGVATGGQR